MYCTGSYEIMKRDTSESLFFVPYLWKEGKEGRGDSLAFFHK